MEKYKGNCKETVIVDTEMKFWIEKCKHSDLQFTRGAPEQVRAEGPAGAQAGPLRSV